MPQPNSPLRSNLTVKAAPGLIGVSENSSFPSRNLGADKTLAGPPGTQ